MWVILFITFNNTSHSLHINNLFLKKLKTTVAKIWAAELHSIMLFKFRQKHF